MSNHPLDLSESSAVEPGPWHYGADYAAVYFTADTSKLKELVPRPFAPVDGTCMAYVCEIISVSSSRPEIASDDPDRAIYKEAALGIRCSYGATRGIYFPVMWVDTEWSLLRGLVNGYSKRLADRIVLTKLHPLNPGLKPVSEGTSFSGYCVKGSEIVLRVRVDIEKRGDAVDLVAFGPTFGIRKYPTTDSTQSGVAEAVEILKSNSRFSDVWVGSGSAVLSFDLGELRPYRGAVYRSGFTISGSKVLERL